MKLFVMRLCIVFGVMGAVSHSVQASIVMNYGDYTGATVSNIQVSESTSTPDDSVLLYGAPNVMGNTTGFNSNDFAASSAGGIPDITDGNFSFDIYAHADGIFSLLTDGGGGPFINGVWSGDVDIDDLLALNGIEYFNGATKVSINLENALVALSEAGTQSLIAKKDFSGLSVTAIPEPATMGLICLFTGGLWFARRFFAD